MRRLAMLMAVLCLLAVPSAALAQAGDEQYQDPLAGETGGGSGSSGSGGGSGGGSGSGSSGGDSEPTLSQTPQVTPEITAEPTTSSPGTSSGTASSSSGTGASGSRTQLPNTGVDARLLVLVGAALLLAGIGLRLRTADDRF